MNLRTVTALLTVTACMIMVSCSGKGRSDDQDFYFTTMKTGGEDQVSFDIDLSDTTRVYAISLVSRFKKDAECRNVTFTVSRDIHRQPDISVRTVRFREGHTSL